MTIDKALIVNLLLAGGTFAGINGADNPKAFTQRDYLLQWIDYNRRTTVDSYNAIGHHDARWDDAARKLMELQSRYFVTSKVNYIIELNDLPTFEQVTAAADAVQKTGCDDPLILDLLAIIRQGQSNRDEAVKLQPRATDAMVDSTYPTERIANSVRRRLKSVDAHQEPAMAAHLQQELFDFDLATIQRLDWQGLDRRIVYAAISEDVNGWPIATQQRLLGKLTDKPGDPWLTDIFSGQIHINVGWNARGTDLGNAVTEEGWRILGEQLKLAEPFLRAADAAHPENPEAAIAMITVGLGNSAGLGFNRAWFDRATAGQIDYALGYSAMLQSLMPKWFGSHAEMLQFGLECVNSGRFDTEIPLQLEDAINDIIADTPEGWDEITSPAIADGLSKMLHGYAQRMTDDQHRLYFQSQLIGYAWQLRRFDIGRDTLAETKGHYDAEGVEVADVVPSRTVSGMNAMNGPHAKELRKAETLAAAEHFSDAAAAYTAALASVPPNDLAREWIRGRAQEFAWQNDFNDGKWVDLTPATDLSGWYSVSGNWSCDGKTLTGQSGPDGAMLWCGLRVGPRWELEATFQVPPDVADASKQNPLNVGLLYCFSGVSNYNAIYAQPGMGRAVYQWAKSSESPNYALELLATMPLKVRAVDGVLNGTLDGKSIFKDTKINVLGSMANQHIAFGSMSNNAPEKFEIRDVRIRRTAE